MAQTQAQTHPRTMKAQAPPSSDSGYTVKQAEKDFGACGKILYVLQKTAEPADMDMHLLFGLEACWEQQKARHCLNQEQTNHVSLMQGVFRVAPNLMPPHVREARETAHQIDWSEKVKKMQI